LGVPDCRVAIIGGRTVALLNASSVGDLRAPVPDFERSPRAANKSAKTVEVYGDAARGLIRFLVERRMPIKAAKVRQEHIEAYLEDQVARWKPATANQRYLSLTQLFEYLVEEGEVPDSPMAKMKPPKVAEVPVPVLPEDDLKRLLASATGKGFQERRDAATMRLLIDTGMVPTSL
jgi:site-specific recombinase XerD